MLRDRPAWEGEEPTTKLPDRSQEKTTRLPDPPDPSDERTARLFEDPSRAETTRLPEEPSDAPTRRPRRPDGHPPLWDDDAPR